jgi:ribonuclease D
MTPPLPHPACLITTDDELRALVDTLAAEPIIAVDTESNSLHAYQGRVCLIQISTRSQDYIVDPVSIKQIEPLGHIFASTHIEKVFHACEYDVLCLKRDFGFEINYLFDTLYAARVIDGKMWGLGDLLHAHYGIKPDKSHQLDDWGKRPLPPESLLYAQMDTHYLLPLYDHYTARLAERDALEEIRALFYDISRIDPKEQAFDPEGFWKLIKPQELDKRALAVLAELYQLRDQIAQDLDTPPHRAIDNRTLVRMAAQPPRNRRDLNAVRGLRPDIVRHYADDLLQAIEHGLAAPPPRPPRPAPVDRALTERYMLLHNWRKERAIARGLESNMVISKHTLWQIAERLPRSLEELAQIDGMTPWRTAAYGCEILRLLHGRHAPC